MAHAPIGKPQITYKAYYNDNPLAESLIKTYSSKEKIPSSIKSPGGFRLPLVGIVETITTVLYDAPIE